MATKNKPLSKAKPVRQLLAVLKAERRNARSLRDYYEGESQQEMYDYYSGRALALSGVINMLENKEHFEEVAEIYEVILEEVQ